MTAAFRDRAPHCERCVTEMVPTCAAGVTAPDTSFRCEPCRSAPVPSRASQLRHAGGHVIIVAATIDFADSASRDEAVQASAPVQGATRVDEAGCHAYCFAADPSVPTRIQVYELWDDEASLITHFAHANYAAMRDVLAAHGITAAWNRVYEVGRNEPVYSPGGKIRTKFFADDETATV